MILNTTPTDVQHIQEPVRRIDMSQMDSESIQFMMEQSRDGFYSNKELAPIREYSTNARDAHIEAGIPERPIEITLPSSFAPELKIRDFGKGLSLDQLTDIYFRYWKSTKRNTNTQNGCFGIGAKSALAYSDIYTVTSWNGGLKTVATGQRNGFADIIFNGENVNNEPNGIEITIPIQQKDINKFIHEALEFFKFWDVRPIFHNIDEETVKAAFTLMDTKPFMSGEGWDVRPAGYGLVETRAVMGFIPYKIDWEQVRNSLSPQLSNKISGIFQFLQENLTTLYFDNGTLSFTPNRETLQYNEKTVTSIGEKLNAIYENLLNLITEKIAGAENIWDAKIRYNRIFRKELDGFEKTDTYGGNLSTIETMLNNRIVWNGITIEDGYFSQLNQWDVEDGNIGNTRYYDGEYTPILSTYVKDDNREGVKLVSAGRRRRYYGGDTNRIVCSPRSAVVIQDTTDLSLARGFAHYLLYKSDKKYSQVYVLNLSNEDVRKEFIKHYNFDTVPVTFVSSNELLIKTYVKSIRKPRKDNGVPRGEARPLNCPSMSIENRRSGTYVSSTYWTTETVNARGIDGGGYYVIYNKDYFLLNGKYINHCDANGFWQAIYELALIAGVDISKVYGIHPKFANAAWFKEAVSEGNWINLHDFITENIEKLPKDGIKKLNAYMTENNTHIGINAAISLQPLIEKQDGIAGKLFNELMEINKYWTARSVAQSLRFIGVDGYDAEEADTLRFKEENDLLRKTYPLLFTTNEAYATSSNGNSTYKYSENMKLALANYINLIDTTYESANNI